MTIRTYKKEDEPAVRAMYDESEIQDGFTVDGVYSRVIEEDGVIVGFAAVRMVPEVYVIMGKGHPAAKLTRLRALHFEMLKYLSETGFKKIIALVSPKIERSFLRRLKTFGWVEGCQSAVFLAESNDEHSSN